MSSKLGDAYFRARLLTCGRYPWPFVLARAPQTPKTMNPTRCRKVTGLLLCSGTARSNASWGQRSALPTFLRAAAQGKTWSARAFLPGARAKPRSPLTFGLALASPCDRPYPFAARGI